MTNARYASRSGGPTKPRDHYQDLTDRVIAALEAGTRPWQKPWDPDKTGGPAMPVNGATGRRYRGINTLVLGMSTLAFATSDPRWCTYKQAAERGWQIRRGERGTTVFFFKQLQIEDHTAAESNSEHTKRIPLLRSFTVFHASQIDSIPAFTPPTIEEAPWRRPEAVDMILRNSNATIRVGGDRAFFSPSTDHIQLPPESAFQSPEGWSATAMHELSHWAGASHRLNRDLSGRFGSQDYSREELVADFSSLIIGTELGLPTDVPNHASYIGSWIKILKNDKREIFRAAAAAQKCADYLLAFHPDYAASTQDATESPNQEDEHPLAA
ncbi:MAG TPA: zincin-like metallopeptidase domain-containing protein [Methylocella sp.]|nr:zincin-like metallopeptidase domain-containing protein [Methylocella sp.]